MGIHGALCVGDEYELKRELYAAIKSGQVDHHDFPDYPITKAKLAESLNGRHPGALGTAFDKKEKACARRTKRDTHPRTIE